MPLIILVCMFVLMLAVGIIRKRIYKSGEKERDRKRKRKREREKFVSR